MLWLCGLECLLVLSATHVFCNKLSFQILLNALKVIYSL